MIKDFKQVAQELISKHKIRVLHEDAMDKRDLIKFDYLRQVESLYYTDECKLAKVSAKGHIAFCALRVAIGVAMLVAAIELIFYFSVESLFAKEMTWVIISLLCAVGIVGIVFVEHNVVLIGRYNRSYTSLSRKLYNKVHIYELCDVVMNDNDCFKTSEYPFHMLTPDSSKSSGCLTAKTDYIVIARDGCEPFIISRSRAELMNTESFNKAEFAHSVPLATILKEVSSDEKK